MMYKGTYYAKEVKIISLEANVKQTCWKRADASHGRNESPLLIGTVYKTENKKQLYLMPLMPFMLCVHILQGIVVYFYTL